MYFSGFLVVNGVVVFGLVSCDNFCAVSCDVSGAFKRYFAYEVVLSELPEVVKQPGGVEFEPSCCFEVEFVSESEVKEYGVVMWSAHVFAVFATHVISDGAFVSGPAEVFAQAFHEVLEVLMVESSVWW